jgi:hypothetical protein
MALALRQRLPALRTRLLPTSYWYPSQETCETSWRRAHFLQALRALFDVAYLVQVNISYRPRVLQVEDSLGTLPLFAACGYDGCLLGPAYQLLGVL